MRRIKPPGSQFSSGGEQLRMFMPARELQSKVTESTDRGYNETMGDMWDRKLDESMLSEGDTYTAVSDEDNWGSNSSFDDYSSHGTGIHDSLAEKGYDGPPVDVYHGPTGMVSQDGHHRIAAAANLDMDVHVSHSSKESYKSAEKNRNLGRNWHDVRLGSARGKK